MENNLQQIRLDAGISQEELSKISGISRTVISELEQGKKTALNSKTMLALAIALGRQVTDIFMFNKPNTEDIGDQNE